MVELIDLVNSVIFFLSNLLSWLSFQLASLTVTLSPALLDLFISSDPRICSTVTFPPLWNSDHVVVSVSSNFLSYSQQDAPLHCIAYDYSCTYGDRLWSFERCSMGVCLNSVLLLLLVNFVSEFRLEWMYISLIVSSS